MRLGRIILDNVVVVVVLFRERVDGTMAKIQNKLDLCGFSSS